MPQGVDAVLTYYKTVEGQLVQLPNQEPGCWIRAVAPTSHEIDHLVQDLGLDAGFVAASLDEEEASRIEQEDDQIFVVVDVPYRIEKEDEDDAIGYTTLPLGIMSFVGEYSTDFPQMFAALTAATLPMIIICIIVCILCAYIPPLITFLPSVVGG